LSLSFSVILTYLSKKIQLTDKRSVFVLSAYE